jgi:hypothetical protein
LHPRLAGAGRGLQRLGSTWEQRTPLLAIRARGHTAPSGRGAPRLAAPMGATRSGENGATATVMTTATMTAIATPSTRMLDVYMCVPCIFDPH